MSTENDKLDLIATESARRLKAAITEAHADILETWNQVNAQAAEEERDPVLTLSFAVRLNLGGNSLVTALTFGVKRKFEEAGELPDPNQTELPIDETQTVSGEIAINAKSDFRHGGGGISPGKAQAAVAEIDRVKSRKRSGK